MPPCPAPAPMCWESFRKLLYLQDMRKCFAILCMLLFGVTAFAQTTKVRGVVTDAESGEPVPFAGIFFKDTSIGVTADIDGRYNLETRDISSVGTLVCQLLGYDTVEAEVKPGAFNEVNFRLKLTENQLPGAFVKADNRRIKRLLANIDAHRDRNDPDRHPSYRCKVYNKMELDITRPREILTNKRFVRDFGFVFDYMDTSVVSGVSYLPAMISESLVERRHTSDPLADDETVLANRVSGINPDANLLSQFTGTMHMKVNFYRPFINSFNVEFPSPIQTGGLLFYNYFIIDSLQMDGRKTYLVRYHPKNGISTPALDGEMHIDAEDFALRSIKAKMVHGGNVNWVRDMVYETEYQRMPDSTWFYRQDKFYADFSLSLGDSSKVMSMIGTRQMNYSDIDFSAQEAIAAADGKVKVHPEATYRDEAYWAGVRPYELTDKERAIYKMVDQIQDVPIYKSVYDVIYTLINGYWDRGPVGFGPYMQLFSVNNLEGTRVRLGVHTSKNLSTDFRWTGFLAYGFGDRQLKGGLSYERIFSHEPQRKLTVDAFYDVYQLGRGLSNMTAGNILSSVWGQASKLSPMSNVSVYYTHEFSMNFNLDASVALKRHFGNIFVPMVGWDGTVVPSVAANELFLQARFSREETVNRGFFTKTYVHSDYPIWYLSLRGSVPGLREGDIGYIKPQLEMEWKFRIPPVGMSQVHLNTGTIVGQVPWMFLQMYPGNATNMLDKSAFSCMEFFEFASDSWATLMWYHSFNGFFLGKIPLLRHLQLREELSAKVAYGTLRDKNNGTAPEYGALMRFPEQMHPLDGVPYVELGAGVSNIMRLFRVDFIWRVTHREVPGPDGGMIPARRLFTVNLGMEFRF